MALPFLDEFLEALAMHIGPSKRFGVHLRLYNQFILLIVFFGTLFLSAVVLTATWPLFFSTGLLRLLGFAIDILVASLLTYFVGRLLYKIEGLDYHKLRDEN